MGHLPGLIADLALILITGAVTTLLFRRIKQPLVLGYIIAGFLVGPHFSLMPTVADTVNIKTLADIGVIFLLFSLGLEFSFRKLKHVGGTASLTALIEIIFITVTGYFLGKLMNWSTMDSLFLGGMLASSSTTIIIKAFDEMDLKTWQFAHVVFGILIVEDILVILLMVLLSTIAVARQFEGLDMLITVGKLFFFLILWFFAGIFLIPTFLKKAKKLLDEETLLILSVGLCLGMVVLATLAGFSAELGAFIMGSILAETTSAEKIEHLTKPIKNLFGAVFFISIGMLIDPMVILEYLWPVLWVTLLILFGKLISTTAGALVSGQSLKQSLQIGMSMAQVGEFAFIVAALGLSLGVTSDFLFPVAVGVSAITTFTTPYMIKFSPQLYNFILKALPDKLITSLNVYSDSTRTLQAESSWKVVLKGYRNIIITNGIIIMTLIFLSLEFLFPFLDQNLNNTLTRNIIALIISFGVTAPFFWALMAKRPNNMSYKELWLDNKYNHGPLVAVEITRIIIGIIIIGFLMDSIFPTSIAILVVLPLIIIILTLFSKRIQKYYHRIEGRFISNLNEREMAETVDTPSDEILRPRINFKSEISLWDSYIYDLELNQQSEHLGKKLDELCWLEQYGVNVAYIKRGDKLILAPGKQTRLFPFDHVGLIGTDEQIQVFKPIFDASENTGLTVPDIEDIEFHKIIVDKHFKFKGVTIGNSEIRQRVNGLVIGIERNKARILNPGSDTRFEWGDIVWIIGEKEKIMRLSDD